MLFNSLIFLFVFLPIVLAGTRAIRIPRGRIIFWTLASYVFYGFAGPWFVLLMLSSTIVDFVVARQIDASTSPRARRLLLIGSLSFSLALLGFFKYFNFFLDTIGLLGGGIFPGLAGSAGSSALDVILPPGISFYTFESMSYTIDVYRRRVKPETDFWYFASFIALFPHLIAGPILRPAYLIPQLHRVPSGRAACFQEGLFLFAAGLIKKVLIADRIAAQVDPVFADITMASTPIAWLAILGFAVQIYFDFSGYSDMAWGLAKLLGLEFVQNFNSPYRALDPSDFWRRWHISLSTWLRDYLYIPLGGSRGGELRTYRNLMVTMLLGGLWHGASWNFVLWGGMHGAALVLYRRFRSSWDALPAAARWAAMMVFLLLTWVPFRLHSLENIAACYRLMFALDFSTLPSPKLVAVTLVGAGLAIVARRSADEMAWGALRPAAAAILGLVTFVALMFLSTSDRFLYFQF